MKPIPVTIAIEGGGSLGAFAWGVLEVLLDAPELRIEAVSGASAGAMNAAMLVQGLATGGPREAQRLLESFWRRVAMAWGSPDMPGSQWLHLWNSQMAPMVDALRQSAGAFALGNQPRLAQNPLRGVLDGLLEPRHFGTRAAPTLIVAATRIRSGEARLFRDAEVTADALLASACLPQIFLPVEIDGEAYWDGGYASNPPLRALIEAGAPADTLIIRCTPLDTPDIPQTQLAIQERTHEIACGAAFRQEMRSLALAQELLTDMENLPEGLARLSDARVHMIGAEAAIQALPGGSRRDPTWGFLSEMRELGRAAAAPWLKTHLSEIGRRSTLDLSRFSGPLIAAHVAPVARDHAA
jgi:NTE family protein